MTQRSTLPTLRPTRNQSNTQNPVNCVLSLSPALAYLVHSTHSDSLYRRRSSRDTRFNQLRWIRISSRIKLPRRPTLRLDRCERSTAQVLHRGLAARHSERNSRWCLSLYSLLDLSVFIPSRSPLERCSSTSTVFYALVHGISISQLSKRTTLILEIDSVSINYLHCNTYTINSNTQFVSSRSNPSPLPSPPYQERTISPSLLDPLSSIQSPMSSWIFSVSQPLLLPSPSSSSSIQVGEEEDSGKRRNNVE